MAGPSYLSVGNVVNPFEGAQKSLSEVGSIYDRFEKNVRQKEEDERNERLRAVQRQQAQENINTQQFNRTRLSDEDARKEASREFIRSYNPNLGVDGKGVDQDLWKANMKRQEDIRKRYASARESGATGIPTDEELTERFSAINQGLVTKKATVDALSRELLQSGHFTPEQVQSIVPTFASNTIDLASLRTQADEAADKGLDAQQKRQDRILDILRINNSANTANNASQNARLSASKKSSSLPGGGAYTGKDMTLAEEKALAELLEEGIGGMDTSKAMRMMTEAQRRINEDLRKAGYATDSYIGTKAIYPYLRSQIDYGTIDSDLAPSNSEEFQAGLEQYYGLPSRDENGNYVSPDKYKGPIGRNSGSFGYGSSSSTNRGNYVPDPTLVRGALMGNTVSRKSASDLRKELLDARYGDFVLPTTTAAASPVPAPTTTAESNVPEAGSRLPPVSASPTTVDLPSTPATAGSTQTVDTPNDAVDVPSAISDLEAQRAFLVRSNPRSNVTEISRINRQLAALRGGEDTETTTEQPVGNTVPWQRRNVWQTLTGADPVPAGNYQLPAVVPEAENNPGVANAVLLDNIRNAFRGSEDSVDVGSLMDRGTINWNPVVGRDL